MIKAKRGYWKNYCSEPLELVENYQQALAENFKGWCIHHRLEIQPDGTRVSAKELNDKGLYYGRPANELVFMRNGEHHRLHWIGNTFNKGKHHSAEHRQKISEALKGRTLSEETRQKISEALSGENHPLFGKHHSEDTRNKLSEALSGENNPFFGKHHSEETRTKLSEAIKCKHWYNNGVKCIRAKTCPEGFVPGRLK